MMQSGGAKAKYAALLMLLMLPACIPRGVDDYSVKSSSQTDTAPRAAPTGPVVLVPEAEVIAPSPSWSPAKVQRNGQFVAGKSYIVRAGDTLYRIGNETGAGSDAIARANDLPAPYSLRVGQLLDIPAGLYHRIGAGETGIAIARAYGVSWADVVSLNALTEPFMLRAGQFIRLPDTASAMAVQANAQSAQDVADAFTLNIDDIVTGSQPARPEAGRPAAAFASAVPSPANFLGSFTWPLNGKLIGRFGSQGGGRVNDGINIAAGLGSPVAAASDGVVVYSGNEISVFGGLVMVDHGDGWITAYGHLRALNVARGDRVKRGQPLGSVGDTGYVDTPQLHFEIRKDRKPVDPLIKLPAR
jgi:murein DD-endopeptidase MepM/ murein hydrolase activator NlpD